MIILILIIIYALLIVICWIFAAMLEFEIERHDEKRDND